MSSPLVEIQGDSAPITLLNILRQIYALPGAPNETARLDALRQYDILDSESETAYDNLAKLAAHICKTPIALAVRVDEQRQWFKARVGLDAT